MKKHFLKSKTIWVSSVLAVLIGVQPMLMDYFKYTLDEKGFALLGLIFGVVTTVLRLVTTTPVGGSTSTQTTSSKEATDDTSNS